MRTRTALRWLAVVVALAAAAIAANVVLLDVASRPDDAVGKLSPRLPNALIGSQTGSAGAPPSSVGPSSSPDRRDEPPASTSAGSDDDDHPADDDLRSHTQEDDD